MTRTNGHRRAIRTDHEDKPHRKEWHTRNRARVRQALAHGNFDAIRQLKRTGGWETW